MQKQYVVKSYMMDGIILANRIRWTIIDHKNFDTMKEVNNFIEARKMEGIGYKLKFSIWQAKENEQGFNVILDERV